jgi:hypothetical protein
MIHILRITHSLIYFIESGVTSFTNLQNSVNSAPDGAAVMNPALLKHAGSMSAGMHPKPSHHAVICMALRAYDSDMLRHPVKVI